MEQQLHGFGREASDLTRIMMWANNDPQMLRRLCLEYPRATRITVPMVTRFLDKEYRAAHPHTCDCRKCAA